MQNHYNLIYREEEREMIPLCVDQGVGLIPWSPLARGYLARNRVRIARARPRVRAVRRLRAQDVLLQPVGLRSGLDEGDGRSRRVVAYRTRRSPSPGCLSGRA